ncbi:MAG: glycosyltransferase family 4 protein [Caldilineaceae bacterium]|nr:glycosyltransferase family 4 protein [Caldilineaceae bacterium]
MRILHVTHQYAPAIGGSEQYITQLSEEMARRGHTVSVFTSRSVDYRTWADTLPRHEVRNGVSITRFTALPRRGATWRMLDMGLRNYDAGPAWLWEPLIWYGNGPVMPGLYPSIRRHAQEFDLVHISQLHYAHAWPAFRAAKSAGLPIVMTPHLHAEQRETYDVGYMRNILRGSDAVIAVTRAEKAFIQRQKLSARVIVGGNSLQLSEFPLQDGRAARHAFGLPEDAFVVLFLGRKTGYKGLDKVLTAFRTLYGLRENVYLLAVGAETDESRRLWAEQGALPGVIVRDAVSNAERLAALAACDVLAMPSTGEAFGIVYLEAWAYGKPVIGADIQAVAALINDGVNGFIIDPTRPAALAARLAQLADDPPLAAAMGAQGHAELLARYTLARQGDIVENLYRRVIRHGGSA